MKITNYIGIHLLSFLFCLTVLGCENHSLQLLGKPAYTEEEINFINPADGVRLAGSLLIPQGEGPFPAVVLVSGSGPHGRDLLIGSQRIMFILADHLARNGIASIRYDKRGCAQSGGYYEPHDIEKFTADALSAVPYLKTQKAIDPTQIGAIGLSQGGMIVPMMAVQSKEIGFIVLLAAPGLGLRGFASVSSIAIARACGFSENDVERIRELYDLMWPIYTKPDLSPSEENEAKRYLAEIAGFMDYESSALLNVNDTDGYFAFMRSRHVLGSQHHDPAEVLRNVQCPVLALTGSKDVQIPAQDHLPVIERALIDGGNPDFTVMEMNGMNHIFQKCRSGLPNEYFTRKRAMNSEVLEHITRWIMNLQDSR